MLLIYSTSYNVLLLHVSTYISAKLDNPATIQPCYNSTLLIYYLFDPCETFTGIMLFSHLCDI